MHRPTRQHRNLVKKLERKASRSRRVGKKARRWKKSINDFQALVADGQDA